MAYKGFELIASKTEDIKNAIKNLPRSFDTSVVLLIALYVLIAIK